VAFTAHDAARHTIQRARGLLAASKTTKSAVVSADLRRLSVVMAVAALDTYLHRLILERVYRPKSLPKSLGGLSMTFSQLLEQADETAVAARQAPHNSRPRVGVKRQLRDRLLRETFQRFDDVSRALSMAGHDGKWDAVGRAMSPAMSTDELRQHLNAIVQRRNRIVHEGDYEPLERPRGPRRVVMRSTTASSHIGFLDDLIEAIHKTL
jgi:hypothetical protein